MLYCSSAGLQTLDLSWCQNLRQIPWPSIGLEKLVVTECHALEKITSEGSTFSISHGACFNLNYVQWGFKILPVREIDVELLNSIGFFNLDYMADVEAFIVNAIVWSRKKRPIQVLYQNLTFTTIYPGRKVPHWFSNKNRGSTVSFTVTLSPHFCIRGLNLCVVYTLPAERDWLPYPVHFEIISKSSGRKTVYKPCYYGLPEEGGDLVWLSYCFGANLFRAGDEVEVSFGITSDGEIKECGVHLLYLEDMGQVSQYYSTLHHSWDSRMFPYVPYAVHSSSHSTPPTAPSGSPKPSGTSPSKSAPSPSSMVAVKGHVSSKNSWQAASSNLLPSSTLRVQSPGEVSFADLMDPVELEGLIARIEKPPIQSTPLSSNEAAVLIQRGLLISLQSSTISIDDIITRTNGIVSVLKIFNVDLSPLYEKVKALVKYSALWAKVADTSDRDVSLGELDAQCEEKKAKFEGMTRSYGEILASASKLTEHVSSLEEEIIRMKEVLKNLEFELSSWKENISKSQRDFNAAMDAVEQRKKKSVLYDTVKEALDDARASLVALSSL